LLVLAGGLAMAVVVAYLIAADQWYLAVAMIVAPPGLILLHKYPTLGLIVWLLVTPFLMAISSTAMRRVYWIVHRGLPPMLLGLMVISSIMGFHKFKVPRPAWFEIAAVGYIVVTIFSIWLTSPDPVFTTTEAYDRVIIPILLYILIRILVQDEKAFVRLLPILLFIALSQAFFGFVYVSARDLLPNAWIRTQEEGARATGSLRQPSTYSTTLLFAGGIMLHAALSGFVKGNNRLVLIGAFAACAMAVFFTFSRASWLAGIAFMIGMLVIYPKQLMGLALVGLPVVAILGGSLLVDQISYASNRVDADESALSRLPVMLASVRMFGAKPVFGWGYGNFDLYDRQFQGRVGDLTAPRNDHASHNLYLTLLSEQGFTGLALYLAPAIGLLALSLKHWRSLPIEGLWSRKLLAILWLVIISHIIVNNLSNMRNMFGLGVWWITLALIAALVTNAARSSNRQPTATPFNGRLR